MLQSQTHDTHRTTPVDAASRAQRIRELNDHFRTSGVPMSNTLGRKVFTIGVRSLGLAAMVGIAEAVMAFTDFTDANDPHGEHDFGALDFNGSKIFWKIDYYTPDLKHGSPDPADPDITCRVLTIMLSSEY
jgi:Protein of unknown function (DUF3768)